VRFTWDDAKRLSNLEKHDLDFADAALVYDSENKVTLPEIRRGEHRLVDIAMVEVLGRILLLAYVLRQDEVRVISFRVAHRKERRTYEALSGKPN
jgi:uncharacterized DUF497 family protein